MIKIFVFPSNDFFKFEFIFSLSKFKLKGKKSMKLFKLKFIFEIWYVKTSQIIITINTLILQKRDIKIFFLLFNLLYHFCIFIRFSMIISFVLFFEIFFFLNIFLNFYIMACYLY